MHAQYQSNGTIDLVFDSVEDEIILTRVFGVSTNHPTPLVFEPNDSSNLLVFTLRPPVRGNHGLSVMQLAEVMKHIQHNEKLVAVKLVKEYTGRGLKESKEIIDALAIY